MNGWQSMECTSLPCQCIQPGLHQPGSKRAKSLDAMLHLAPFDSKHALQFLCHKERLLPAQTPLGSECQPFSSARGCIAVLSTGGCHVSPTVLLLREPCFSAWSSSVGNAPGAAACAVRKHWDSTATGWRRGRNLLLLVQGGQK